jgi:hypothetical protein
MTLGLGIAIAGVWVFAGLAWHSKHITTPGMLVALGAAGSVTVYLVSMN